MRSVMSDDVLAVPVELMKEHRQSAASPNLMADMPAKKLFPGPLRCKII